jgi:hypothetical protein
MNAVLDYFFRSSLHHNSDKSLSSLFDLISNSSSLLSGAEWQLSLEYTILVSLD